jgi:hypothetical protein
VGARRCAPAGHEPVEFGGGQPARLPAAQHEGVAHAAELPHVPGRVVAAEACDEVRGEPRSGLRERGPEQMAAAGLRQPRLKKMNEQPRDVGPAFTQRREADLVRGQSEVQRRPEAALGDVAVEIRVGGRHDPHVDGRRRATAQRRHLARLQRAQQRRLHLHRRVADLVEEEGAAVGPHEVPVPGGVGPAERAPGVAEKFGSRQRRRHRGHVDGHVPPRPTRARRMERRRDELLPGARLAPQENGARVRRDTGDGPPQAAHRVGVADQGIAGGRLRAPLVGVLQVQDEHEMAAQLQHHTAFQLGRAEVEDPGEQGAVHLDPGVRAGGVQPHRAAPPPLDHERLAAHEGRQQRHGRRGTMALEEGFRPPDLEPPPGVAEGRRPRALADPRGIGVMREGQRDHPLRRGLTAAGDGDVQGLGVEERLIHAARVRCAGRSRKPCALEAGGGLASVSTFGA